MSGKRPEVRCPAIMGINENGEYVPIKTTEDGQMQSLPSGLPATSFEQFEVDGSLVSTLSGQGSHALVDVQDADVIVRFDGGDPNNGGHLIPSGSTITLDHPDNITQLQILSAEGNTATISVTYFGGE